MRRRTVHMVIGAALCIGVGVFAVWRSPQVQAALVSLGVDQFESWAWVGVPVDQDAQNGPNPGMVPTSAIGFVHFNCDSNGSCDPAVDGGEPNLQIDGETGVVSGYGWFGTGVADAGTPHAIGWLNFDPPPLPDASPYADASCPVGSRYPGPPCVDASIDTTNQQELFGWARIESLAAEGDAVLGTLDGDNDWGWVLLRGTNTADGAEFGVLYRNNRLEGWMWSGGGSAPTGGGQQSTGLGWISLDVSGPGSPGGPAGGYLSTERGDVYLGGGVENPAGSLSPTQFNATFMLLADGSLVNFTSENLGGTTTDASVGFVGLPDATNNFSSQLGEIPYTELITPVNGTQNVFGHEVDQLVDFSTLTGSVFLDGGVYVVSPPSGTATLSTATTFTNGTALPSSGANGIGAGTIVVEGDLVVSANTFYNNTALVHTDNLASVAWIVRGDLIVEPHVSNMVGAFYVLGDDTIGDGTSDGLFITQPSTATQLQVYGLSMARGYQLQRQYQGTPGNDEPAELFYYDGRAIVNPAPGFEDYASLLPLIDTAQ